MLKLPQNLNKEGRESHHAPPTQSSPKIESQKGKGFCLNEGTQLHTLKPYLQKLMLYDLELSCLALPHQIATTALKKILPKGSTGIQTSCPVVPHLSAYAHCTTAWTVSVWKTITLICCYCSSLWKLPVYWAETVRDMALSNQKESFPCTPILIYLLSCGETYLMRLLPIYS